MLCDLTQRSDFWHATVQTDVQLSLSEKARTAAREQSERVTPSHLVVRLPAGPLLIHSFPLALGFSGVWFSDGEIQAGARDLAEDERRQRGQRAAHQNERLWANPRLEKVEPLRRDVSGQEMDGLARTLHQNLNDVSWMSTSKATESKWAHVSEKGGTVYFVKLFHSVIFWFFNLRFQGNAPLGPSRHYIHCIVRKTFLDPQMVLKMLRDAALPNFLFSQCW